MKTLRRLIGTVQHQATSWHEHWWQASASRQGQPAADKRAHLTDRYRGPILAVTAIVSLTSVIGYHFYNEPKLDVGKQAPQTIRAPKTVSIPDNKTTDEQRKQARTGSVPVLMLDQTVNQQIHQDLQKFLDRGQALRDTAGVFPFTQPGMLSRATQSYLRRLNDQEWQSLVSTFTSRPSPSQAFPLRSSLAPSSANQNLALEELEAYQQTTSPESFAQLLATIARAQASYARALQGFSDTTLVKPDNFYDPSFLDWSDETWVKTQNAMQAITERILSQGIPPGLPEDILQQLVKDDVSKAVPESAQLLAIQGLTHILRPNLVTDRERTRERAEQAAQAVETVLVNIKQGEVIVYSGEKITQADFVLLDHFGLSRREINWPGLIGFGGLVSGSVGIFWLIKRRYQPGLRRRDQVLLLLLSLTAPLPAMVGLPATSLPLVGLLSGSFYGSALGLAIVGLLSVTLAVGMDIGSTYLIATVVGGLVGALVAGRLRSREEFALLGLVVGITQGTVYLLLNMVIGPAWYVVLGLAAMQGLIGITWSVVALGCSPYLEHLFDLVTPIRLAELANPNRPLLKRLASEAPGTFQHTLFVATLAEAAARRLGCDVELVRTGCLYHDIGKMHDPLAFIENQMGGPNKHDEINDPWQSAEIIRKHVTEGLVMARKFRLPKAITAFIPEHQGTMQIVYFYHQAQERSRQDPDCLVKESDFRYAGPTPQSRETGIVMLADSCEAALRSLKDVCTDEARIMINKILRSRWQDGQLVDAGLTREDLSQIAEVFVQVWQQFNHQRIAYPKLPTPPTPAGV
ncbi:hypothetical protein BST81_03800 [Leptolyngbya sp. 'hensonii']|uniref:HD family phosphohydrolase n=1 Tax=Leptolyngbya sp. 'hensonii' TaxID=1922337 RepID=UPI00094FBCBD|nr:HDIG domain-containing metalloprotein [Leptolyngbya sp. 'hensonii']OLP19676.1 hypothetical protein BST81_03800 [Leptolyngbya sp. 'hensonii']